MAETEESLLALLRRWKCVDSTCGHEHKGEPSPELGSRACPKCGADSRRTHEVLAVEGSSAELADYVVIRKKPTRGKLCSMALRYDHSIFAPKQTILGATFGGATPVQIAAVLTTMTQLHEEVAETGFYKPERESEYANLLTDALSAAAEDRTAD